MAAKIQHCILCGSRITLDNGWKMPEELGGSLVPYCEKCMEKMYKLKAGNLGYKLALFFCCAEFEVPYLPEHFERAKKYTTKERGIWGAYLMALREINLHRQGGRCANFKNGLTDLRKAFDGKYATIQVDDTMLDDELYQQGRIAQERAWGLGPAEHPYTQEDYDALDQFYDALLENRVNVSAQAEIVIKNVAVMRLEQRRCVYEGEYQKAKQIEEIINKEMESEQLRKKDELPQDRARLDDIVLAIERSGLPIMDYEQLCEALGKWMFHSPYGYTRDAADQMLLLIHNATAWNEGRPELDRLPDEFAIADTLGEFAKEQDETEKKNYRDLDLTPLNMGENPRGGEL